MVMLLPAGSALMGDAHLEPPDGRKRTGVIAGGDETGSSIQRHA
jgi:hypothetical protein